MIIQTFTQTLRIFYIFAFFIVGQTVVFAANSITVPAREPITMVDTVTAGFVGLATQGPFDQSTLVQSYSQYVSIFGEPESSAPYRHLGLAARAFFDNGGTRLYVVRAKDSSQSALLGDVASQTGLAALATVDDVAMIAAPGFTDTVIHSGLILHCQQFERFCLLDPTSIDNVSAVVQERDLVETTSGHAALFFPWVRTVPVSGQPEVDEPPSGFVAGVYARITSSDGVWKAPAGLDAGLIGTAGLTYALTSADIDSLNVTGVISIRDLGGSYGSVIWGARTVSRDPELQYVSVRRTKSALQQSFSKGLSWTLYEPNDSALWTNIVDDSNNFLNDLFRQGAFQGVTPSDAYFSICGLGSTMTTQDVQSGIIRASIGFAALRPAEFTVINLVFDQSNVDTDQDGLLDSVEDANSNGVVDAGETDPLDPDSDGDGLLDGDEDVNANGIVDAGETSALDFDSDDDGLTDGFEVMINYSDPTTVTSLILDSDGDGLTDVYETNVTGTDPATFDNVYTDQTLPAIGDLNGDGKIDTGDLLLLQREILNP